MEVLRSLFSGGVLSLELEHGEDYVSCIRTSTGCCESGDGARAERGEESA